VLCNEPNINWVYILSSFYRRIKSEAAVNCVLVKVNRSSGLKVVKKEENCGRAN